MPVFCKKTEAHSADAKTRTASRTPSGFFLPKKTIARAIQPRPAEILGTKDERRSTRRMPLREAKRLAIIQEKWRKKRGFNPC